MDTTSEQLGVHLEQARDALGSNMHELERKMKSVTDWEQHYRNMPGTSLALAFGSGFLLSAIVGGGRSRRSKKHKMTQLPARPQPRMHIQEDGRNSSSEAWDKFKGAVFGVASTRLLQVVEDWLPGSKNEDEPVQHKNGAAQPGAL